VEVGKLNLLPPSHVNMKFNPVVFLFFFRPVTVQVAVYTNVMLKLKTVEDELKNRNFSDVELLEQIHFPL